MRKFTMLFVAAVVAMSVNAQNTSNLKFFSKVNYGELKDSIAATDYDKDGVIVVKAGEMTSQAWDNQFWVAAPAEIAKGNPYSFSMDIKADSVAAIGNQIHGAVGTYVHYTMFSFQSVSFTTDWKKFEFNGNMEAKGSSIALNLNDDPYANTYYFKNIKWNTAGASFRDDSLSFVFVGETPTELKAENFTVFVNSVSSTAEFNALTSVSATAMTSVSTTVFASISNTLEKVGVKKFDVEDNVVTFQLEKVLEKDAKLFVAYNNTVYGATYKPKPIRPAVEVAAVAEFSVYPNPVNDVLNVACEAGVANVAIFDVAGRMVKVSNEDVINVADLKAGLYIVKVTDMNGANGTTKIMK